MKNSELKQLPEEHHLQDECTRDTNLKRVYTAPLVFLPVFVQLIRG